MRWNMRAERARRGLTVEELAEKIGVNRSTVNRWETGQSAPTADSLVRLAQFFQATPEYLMGITSDPHGDAIVKKEERS